MSIRDRVLDYYADLEFNPEKLGEEGQIQRSFIPDTPTWPLKPNWHTTRPSNTEDGSQSGLAGCGKGREGLLATA
jgi:hypothetical protein